MGGPQLIPRCPTPREIAQRVERSLRWDPCGVEAEELFGHWEKIRLAKDALVAECRRRGMDDAKAQRVQLGPVGVRALYLRLIRTGLAECWETANAFSRRGVMEYSSRLTGGELWTWCDAETRILRCLRRLVAWAFLAGLFKTAADLPRLFELREFRCKGLLWFFETSQMVELRGFRAGGLARSQLATPPDGAEATGRCGCSSRSVGGPARASERDSGWWWDPDPSMGLGDEVSAEVGQDLWGELLRLRFSPLETPSESPRE